jgi:hypothetical protein
MFLQAADVQRTMLKCQDVCSSEKSVEYAVLNLLEGALHFSFDVLHLAVYSPKLLFPMQNCDAIECARAAPAECC